MDKRNVLELIKINKCYVAGNPVLIDVDFNLKHGEIHALVGQNGAGKSTLMKILSGITPANSGQIKLGEIVLENLNPALAREVGIGIVHQEFALCDDLTVAQNIFLGREKVNKMHMLDHKEINSTSQALLEKLSIEVNKDEYVRNLSVADQQLVEIAKGIFNNPKILILDEPTAALTLEEVKNLFAFLKTLKSKGVSIIYITHRLQELLDIADSVTILRDGRVVDTKEISETCIDEIVSLMIGSERVNAFPEKPKKTIGEDLLVIKNLSVRGRLDNINIKVKKGEILGLAGLVGCGQKELAECIFGYREFDSGEIYYLSNLFNSSPKVSVKNGIGFISEDRKLDGLFMEHSILKNVSIIKIKDYVKYGFINQKKEKEEATRIIDSFNLTYSTLHDEVQYLSGGNQQKIVIAKWLLISCKLLIINELTRGIDIGAKRDIYKHILNIAKTGISVLMISSELNELIGLCDRIYVMRDGSIIKNVVNDNIFEEDLLKYSSDKSLGAEVVTDE